MRRLTAPLRPRRWPRKVHWRLSTRWLTSCTPKKCRQSFRSSWKLCAPRLWSSSFRGRNCRFRTTSACRTRDALFGVRNKVLFSTAYYLQYLFIGANSEFKPGATKGTSGDDFFTAVQIQRSPVITIIFLGFLDIVISGLHCTAWCLTRYLVNKITITIVKRKATEKKKKSEFQGKATFQVTHPKRPFNGTTQHVAQFPYTSKKF